MMLPILPSQKFIGGAIQENVTLVQRANPITYITEGDPPFLHLHGSKDRLVPLSQSQLLDAALRKAGVQTELHVVVDGDHGFRGAREPMRDIIDRSIRFLNRHCGKLIERQMNESFLFKKQSLNFKG